MNHSNTAAPQSLLQTIQMEALDMSGLSYDRAFALDDANIANEVDNFAFLNVSDIFFRKLLKEPLFRYCISWFFLDSIVLISC